MSLVNNKLGYIYVIYNPSFITSQVKIGSTKNYVNRYHAYKTYHKDPSTFIKVYRIDESKFNCYVIDELLKKYSEKFNITRYRILGGGTEHYILKNISYLEIFFKTLNIKFKDITSEINIDKLKKNTKTNIELKQFDLDEEIEYLKQINNFNFGELDINDKIEKYKNKNSKYWGHQQKVIDKWNYKSGILAHATGLGKTVTGYGLINKFLRHRPNSIILWHTKLKDIILSQKDKIGKFKKNNILPTNLRVEIYIDEIPKNINGSTGMLIICNSAKLPKILKQVKPDLVLTDECHDITGDKTYEILDNLKKEGVINLGLSATPIKETNKSYKRIYQLYDNNFIDSITLLDAIMNKIVLPIDIEWVQIKMEGNIPRKFDKKVTEKIIKYGIDSVKKIINNSSTGKVICWTRFTNTSDMWKKELELQGYNNIYQSYAKNDPKCDNLKEYIKQTKAIILCVNRFRQGTDDPSVDTGIFLDIVQNRMSHVDLQMKGRLCRKLSKKMIEQYEGDVKKRAKFIEVCETSTEDEKIMKLCHNIITYCEQLHSDFLEYKFIIITDAEGNKKIAIESNIICKEYPITFSILNTNENKKFYKKTVKELNEIRKRQLMKKGISLETFVKILKDNNISNIRRYHSFREEYIQMDLPYAIWLDYPDFRWNMTNSKKFYDIKECIQKIIELNEQYEEELEQIEDHVEKFDFLHSKDNKIPNHTLWKFYNAERDDFIIFN